MKLSILIPLTAILVGCASAPPRQAEPPSAPVEEAPAKPTVQTIDRATFSVSLPSDWIVRPGPGKTNGQVTQELVARSPEMVGQAPALVAINTVNLNEPDDPKDEDFGGAVALGMMKSGAQVILAQPQNVSGLPGSILMAVTPSGMMFIQTATASKRTGFVVRCGGDTHQGDKIIELCQPIIESFKVKK